MAQTCLDFRVSCVARNELLENEILLSITLINLSQPLFNYKENGHILHEHPNETDVQRQRTDTTNSSNPNSRRPRRPEFPVADIATSRFSSGTSDDSAPRRSHGTWAHGATTAAGQSYRGDDVAAGRSRAPTSGNNRPCRSPARNVVIRRPNDVTTLIATSRTELSSSTAVVKTIGDVVSGVRLGLTRGDIGDNSIRTEHDVMHNVTSQLQSGYP